MSLTSIRFLFLFFPLTLVLYRLGGRKGRPYILLLLSLLFGWLSGGKGLLVLITVTLFTYAAGFLLEYFRGRRPGTLLFIFFTGIEICLLALYKYGLYFPSLISSERFPFSLTQGLMPVGLSFYVFQSISYLADIHDGEAVLRHPVQFGIYMTFFPKMLAGPLVRLKDFRQDLSGPFPARQEVLAGFERFLTGLCKKIILADQLAKLISVTDAFSRPDTVPVSCLWITSIAYTLQLYFDFAGYSDMAIGLGQMFGFHLPENFRDPYCCRTLTDFWRRWHISLSQWFRDYVYIPLGGSRKGTSRTIFHLLLVWTLTGAWHGSSICFLFWGLGHCIILIAEKFFVHPDDFKTRAARLIYRFFTLLCINLLWIFFQVSSISQARSVFAGLFGLSGQPLFGPPSSFFLVNSWFFLLAGILLASPLVKRLRAPAAAPGRIVTAVLWFAAILLAVSYIIQGAYNPFVYQIF